MKPLRVLLVFLIADLAFPQHSGYWNQSTPKRTESRDCRLVETQDELLSELRSLSWDMGRIPIIDWKNDCVIIIAPSYYYKEFVIAFFGLDWDGDAGQYNLNWGWATPKDDAPSPGSVTFGSRSPGRETIVVSFKHGMHAANKFQCSERKP